MSKALTSGRGKLVLVHVRAAVDVEAGVRQAAEAAAGRDHVGERLNLEKFAVDSAKADDQAVAAVYVKAGAKVADLDDAALAKWQVLAKPVWKDYADKNENCAKLLALAQKLL